MVQIQSKKERGFWASAAINSIPDVAIAWIASDYLAIGAVGFLGVLFGIQLLYFVIWIKRIAWAWLIFWISARRKSIEHEFPLSKPFSEAARVRQWHR
jgi:hypothetical protein